LTTTLGADRLPTRTLWKAAHARWDIENDHFNTLATNWHLNHCFKHTPTAILNFILTLYIAFLLVQTFYLRNLKPPRRHRFTLIAITRQLYAALPATPVHAPWLAPFGGRPPQLILGNLLDAPPPPPPPQGHRDPSRERRRSCLQS